MWAAIAAIAQLLYLIINTKFERDAAERKRKDEALAGWDQAVKSGDISRINATIDRVRS